MAREPAIDKYRDHVSVTYEVKEKVMAYVAKRGESFTACASRVLTDLVKDKSLSEDALKRINAKIAQNYERRIAEREKRRKARSAVMKLRSS